MMPARICPLKDYAAEQAKIAAGLRPLLASLAAQSIQAGNIEAATPLIIEAARVLSAELVTTLRNASVQSFNDGVAAGLLRNDGGALQ